ncbi:MAG TPA: haloacid dehalogenase type II [Gaiellales bacterium]
MGVIPYGDFDVLTFDCYGTLIDWEAGIAAAARLQLGDAVAASSDEEIVAAFAAVEHEAEVPYKSYREVLALCLHGIGERLGVTVGDAQARGFGSSVGQWPAFPDSADALARLQERFKLAVITNCDDDLFAQSERRLGVQFDYVVSAQQAGSYKPDHANFELAFARIDEPRERILHVAQSLFHDHVPAKALGMTSVWIDRRQGRGGGASPDVDAHPDATFPSMRAFADDAVPA